MKIKQLLLAGTISALLAGCGSAENVLGQEEGTQPDDTIETLHCSTSAEQISALYSQDAQSDRIGEEVTVEGVVHGVFARANQLAGFFMQVDKRNYHEDAPVTQGIFVHYANISNLKLGQHVVVRGTLEQVEENIQLSNVDAFVACATKDIVRSHIRFPIEELSQLERYKGMAVQITGPEFITDHAYLEQKGQLALSTEELRYPTEFMSAGEAVHQKIASYHHMTIILDDGSTVEYPEQVIYPSPGLSASNPLRIGDRMLNLQGVMYSVQGQYVLEPVDMPTLARGNAREEKPKLPEQGDLRLADVDLWQYIPGTHSFARQRPKVTSMFDALQADIIGVQQVRNDGVGQLSALQDLVDMLNAATEGSPYAFVQVGEEVLGEGEYINAILYRLDKVKEVGQAAALATGQFDGSIHTPSYAQTFEHLETGKRVTYAVHQLVGRDCDESMTGNPLLSDAGDGQECASLAREQGAQQINQWLATQPTGVAAPTFHGGTINAFQQEEAVQSLLAQGYTSSAELASSAYTVIRQGMKGNLDYIFVPEEQQEAVVGATTWKIAADEPDAFNYLGFGRTESQLIGWYSNSFHRFSSRNPVVVQLDTTKLR